MQETENETHTKIQEEPQVSMYTDKKIVIH